MTNEEKSRTVNDIIAWIGLMLYLTLVALTCKCLFPDRPDLTLPTYVGFAVPVIILYCIRKQPDDHK